MIYAQSADLKDCMFLVAGTHVKLKYMKKSPREQILMYLLFLIITEQILYLTEPETWSAAAVYQATRIFTANLNSHMAQR